MVQSSSMEKNSFPELGSDLGSNNNLGYFNEFQRHLEVRISIFLFERQVVEYWNVFGKTKIH